MSLGGPVRARREKPPREEPVRVPPSAVVARVPPQEKRVDPYDVLARCDTIHDFWSERTNPTDDRINKVRSRIEGVFGGKPDVVLEPLLGRKIPLSAPEWPVVESFEQKFGMAVGKDRISYEEILDGTAKQDFATLSDSLELYSSLGRSVNSFSKADREKIATYLLNYLNPNGIPEGMLGITFDASPGDTGHIFEDIDQVKNYIFPQNIADSAVTSDRPLRGRVNYVFPNDSKVKSNVFTKDILAIQFNKIAVPFHHRNKTAFTIDCNKGAASAQLKTVRQGPSVNYLMTLLEKDAVPPANDPVWKPSPAVIVDLEPLEPLVRGTPDVYHRMLFDLKRMGDHEQVNASTTENACYMSTEDILCSLYARFKKKSCFLNLPGRLIVYRFAGDLDPSVQILKKEQFLARNNLEIANISLDFRDNDLSLALVQFITATVTGTMFTSSPKDPFHILAGRIMEVLLRYRMLDLYTYANTLEDDIHRIRAILQPQLEQVKPIYEILSASLGLTSVGKDKDWKVQDNKLVLSDGRNVTDANEQAKVVIEAEKEYRGLKLPANASFFQSLFNITTTDVTDLRMPYVLKPNASHQVFRFTSRPFYDMRDSLIGILRLLGRRPNAQEREKQLEKYETAREAVGDAFYDERMRDTFYRLTDIKRIEGWAPRGTVDGDPELRDLMNDFVDPAKDAKEVITALLDLANAKHRTPPSTPMGSQSPASPTASLTPSQVEGAQYLLAMQQRTPPTSPPLSPPPSSPLPSTRSSSPPFTSASQSTEIGVQALLDFKNLPPLVNQQLLNDTTAFQNAVSYNSEMVGGMKGGNIESREYSDLDELFGQICGMAADIVNSIVVPGTSDVRKLFADNEELVRTTLDSIINHWLLGLENLTTNAQITYGKPVVFEDLGKTVTEYLQNPVFNVLINLTLFDNKRYLEANHLNDADLLFKQETTAFPGVSDTMDKWKKLDDFIKALPNFKGGRRKTYRKKSKRKMTYRRRQRRG
jgi:hypothetical protein